MPRYFGKKRRRGKSDIKPSPHPARPGERDREREKERASV
jgi:hypothetical protein